ncbi:MAG: sulfatase-like hydrolase/transferase [Planctomycetes bacterium]|nr:sulfatase-like hydrolase/transferase [Planctomycetota bacterium]
MNIALITLDTLRADRVGCYGNRAVQTPVLDGLASGGVRFADAVTSVPTTLASHCTIHTGVYPPHHGVRDNGTFRLLDSHQTLAERLKAKGYATAAFIASFVLDGRWGLAQGFDVYDDDITIQPRVPGKAGGQPQRPGNVVIDSAVRWLDEYRASAADGPFFVWVHLFDPHLPHTPPEPYRTRYASNLYDGEVAFTDSQVGRFLDHLRELELLDRTLVVVVGDHGEGLGDHGESTHSLLIYESTAHVPMIFWRPGILPEGLVVDDRVVATVDIVPTILDLLGEEVPAGDGISLLDEPPGGSGRVIYMETLSPELNHGWSPLFGLRRHHDKYIEAPKPEYYDLVNDPGELNNLLAERVKDAERLSKRLEALLDSFPEQVADATVTLDDAARRKLEALGYIGGKKSAPAGSRIDPKDMVAMWERKIATASKLVVEGSPRALPMLQDLLKITLQDPGLWALLSQAQTQAGQFADAIKSREKAIRLQPADASHWIHVARLEYVLGNIELARMNLDAAEEIEPKNGEIFLVRAELARAARDYERAIELCRQGRERDPIRHTMSTLVLEGRIHEEAGRPDKAAIAYQQAYDADPQHPGALLGLAKVAARAKQYQRVVDWLTQIHPGSSEWRESRLLLARTYSALDQAPQAEPILRELITVAPNHPGAHKTLGNALYAQGRHSEAVDSYRTSLKLNPRDAQTHYNLGVVLRDQGSVGEAVQSFRNAVKADPTLHEARRTLAYIHAERGEIEDGLKCLKPMFESGSLTREGAEADPSLRPLVSDPRFAELLASLESP